MSGRKPAKARVAEFLNKLHQQHQKVTSSGQKWLRREFRKHKSRPIWVRVGLVTWQVIEILLTQIQKNVKKYWKQREQVWLAAQTRFSGSGFLLPMVSVLLLVFSLVVAATLLQSINRTTEVSSERSQQVVYNSATVAIDRSKTKIEYMFNLDTRWPRGLPDDDRIESIFLNENRYNLDPPVLPVDIDSSTSGVQDPYTFPDEQRLDLNGDGLLDNAWTFTMDTDGGQVRIAYMLLSRVASDNIDLGIDRDDREATDLLKASNLVVRNGPINMTLATNAICIQQNNNDAGWDVITGATVRRAFQTFVVVVEDQGTQRSVSTLEMQQDREADKGNKWGAWFRNDLEIFPDSDFRWNGAIHTEGNLIIGNSTTFKSYLISAPNSCLYARQNSEITIGGNLDESTVAADGSPVFLGQLIRGSLKTNSYAGSFLAHTHGPNGPQNYFVVNDTATGTLTGTPPQGNHIDSVLGTNTSSPPPIDLSLDPVVLFTTDEDVARNTNPSTNGTMRDANWKNSNLVTQGRIFNRSAQSLHVDDTYRADNRYGPKPRYTQLIALNNNQIGQTIGTTDANANDLINISTTAPEAQGLDGYWERRSRVEGLTVIVGQRLELGNTYGWDGRQDPLYPPEDNFCLIDGVANSGTRCHEQKQWKSLRDNLAAVQSTVVYHNDRNTNADLTPIPSDFPLACLATTAHPGTGRFSASLVSIVEIGTIGYSRTFGRVLRDTTRVDTNFLTGRGTNGWEFNSPGNQTTNSGFATAITSGTNLRLALRNLANFAGDPFGAFPPRQDSRDGNNANDAVPTIGPVVHPYPMLTMWGDYSNLRRVMDLLDGGTAYSNLSMSDQTTVQTAACTLGMLAYNLNNFLSYDYTNATNANNIRQVIRALQEASTTTGSIAAYIANPANVTGGANNATPDDYLEAFGVSTRTATGNTTSNADLLPVVRAIILKEQITRDRRFGFLEYTSEPGTSGTTNWSSATRRVKVNPADNSYFGISQTLGTFRTDVETLARALTATGVTPTGRPSTGVKFPALFYIFPLNPHDHYGERNIDVSDDQPRTEPYIADPYVAAVNNGLTYTAVDPANLVLTPRSRADWVIPNSTTLTDRVNLINDNGTFVATSFLDKGMFNGREMMSVRTLDLDLDLLRRNRLFSNRENWLPYSGIVYTFREDAVREDAIARPTRNGVTFADCNRDSTITSTNCLMDAVSANPADPPVNNTNGISTKPVDFYPDPDRRAHGFRLRNGGRLIRIPDPPAQFQFRGLAFISDNPTYIVADRNIFNEHRSSLGDLSIAQAIEEFTQLLTADWSNFYTRTTLDANFARAGDAWRPAEIMADGITILSANFVDGSIAEGIVRSNVSNTSSYRSLNAPTSTNLYWVRENGSLSNSQVNPIPIRISRNGYPLYCVNPASTPTAYAQVAVNSIQFQYCRRNSYQEQQYGKERERRPLGFSPTTGSLTGTNLTYMAFSDGKTLRSPVDSRVNATIISGLVPSRAQQSYGGLHNFPRFLQSWSGVNLFISGAMIQPYFSTYATAPFDQDSWEPGVAAQTAELINYYSDPNRRWGYDVGLQYSPAGPVASRFVTPSNNRSEFYREPGIDDPYICLLRKARLTGGGTANIDPDTTNCPVFPWE